MSFEEIEKEFGIILPPDYKALISDYPKELLDHDGTNRTFKKYSQGYLLKSVDDLVYYNRIIREKLDNWPSQWFIIGLDRVENYFLFDLESGTSKVYSLGNENYEFEKNKSIPLESLAEMMSSTESADVRDFIFHIYKSLEK